MRFKNKGINKKLYMLVVVQSALKKGQVQG